MISASPLRLLASLPRHAAVLLIRIYQSVHGAFFMGCCRFQPSCSHYAVEAIETRGLGMGILLSAWRIARCHPFCKGGFDPVPVPRSVANQARPRIRLASHSPLGESLE
jgi:putative membrane protein insertion efficiency factor